MGEIPIRTKKGRIRGSLEQTMTKAERKSRGRKDLQDSCARPGKSATMREPRKAEPRLVLEKSRSGQKSRHGRGEEIDIHQQKEKPEEGPESTSGTPRNSNRGRGKEFREETNTRGLEKGRLRRRRRKRQEKRRVVFKKSITSRFAQKRRTVL